MDANTPPTEWQRDAAGANAEFQGGALTHQIREKAHNRVNDLWLEQFRPVGLVPRGYPFIKEPRWHARTLPGVTEEQPPLYR